MTYTFLGVWVVLAISGMALQLFRTKQGGVFSSSLIFMYRLLHRIHCWVPLYGINNSSGERGSTSTIVRFIAQLG